MTSKNSKQNDSRSTLVYGWLPIAAGMGVVMLTGVIYGKYSQRWGPSPHMLAAGEHLESLPAQLGSWNMDGEKTIEESALEMLQCVGHIHRRYVNQQSGAAVSLAILAGPPGPISVHTPEICYSSRAYELQGARKLATLGDSVDGGDAFWTVEFRPRNVLADELCVYYAWSTGNGWNASESPRFDFAGAPLLYKIQLAGLVPVAARDEADPCRTFLEELLRSDWKLLEASGD